jgi:hypothetical protein
LVASAYCKSMPHPSGYLPCVIDLIGNQPIQYQHRTWRLGLNRIQVGLYKAYWVNPMSRVASGLVWWGNVIIPSVMECFGQDHSDWPAGAPVAHIAWSDKLKIRHTFILTLDCSVFLSHVLLLSGISKKYFCPGRKAPSEWTHSVWAVRDSTVGKFSVPGLNTTHRVVYRPPIAVGLVLLALSVFYCKRKFLRWEQPWPYIRMGLLGMRVVLDSNVMGDIAKISPRVPSTFALNAILSLLITHINSSRQIYVAIDNSLLVPSVPCLTTSSSLWN